MTVGMALLPFSLLADDELCLGGISEDCVIVADYDPLQLQSLRVLVEMVNSIDSGASSSAAIRGPSGCVVDWWLPPPKRLQELALTQGWDLERLRSGCLKFEEHVRLHLVDGAIFIVDRRAPQASVDAAIAAGISYGDGYVELFCFVCFVDFFGYSFWYCLFCLFVSLTFFLNTLLYIYTHIINIYTFWILILP